MTNERLKAVAQAGSVDQLLGELRSLLGLSDSAGETAVIDAVAALVDAADAATARAAAKADRTAPVVVEQAVRAALGLSRGEFAAARRASAAEESAR